MSGKILLSTTLAIAMMSLVAFPSLADDAASKENADTKPSVDQQLLESLGGDALAEESSQQSKQDQKSQAPATETIDRELLDGLSKEDEASSSAPSNPLVRLNDAMRQVESLIAQSRTDNPTQNLQAQIIHDLDELIKQSQKQCQSNCSSGSCNKPGSSNSASQPTANRDKVRQPGKPSGQAKRDSDAPARESSDKTRPQAPARVDLAEMKDLLAGIWGVLPERQREQMLQSYEEQFLPKYEDMIADYFRSIAEQQKRP